MIQELEDFIRDNTQFEFAEVLLAAHRTFVAYGAVGSDERFREILNTNEHVEMGGTIIIIRNLTQDIQLELLTQQGVIPEADCSIEQLDILLNGLLGIQDYETDTDLLDCIQDGNSTEETLALMLELVTPWPSETLYLLMESVSDGCIKRIKSLVDRKLYNGVALEQEPPKEVDETAARLRDYVAFLGGKEIMVMNLIDGGLRLGYPLAIYLRTYGNEIAGLAPADAAAELVGMALISGDAKTTPQAAISEIIDEFISSLDQITRIDTAIKDILLRFERHEKA